MADFHGVIPPGEYGAGRMTIWDRGTYQTHTWRPDRVTVTLHGSRVRGRYVLFRTDGEDWLVRRLNPPQQPDWSPLPELLRPMLAEAGRLPAAEQDDHFAYEMKWDGVRAVLYVESGRLRILGRSDREVTGTYPEVRDLDRALGSTQVVLDGEI